MASSQRDFFLSPSQNSTQKLNSSLPTNLVYVYLWCILFDWNENEEEPFRIYQIGQFSTSELKPKWVNGDLDHDSRLKKLTFPSVPGKTVSLFAKVEKCKYTIYQNKK